MTAAAPISPERARRLITEKLSASRPPAASLSETMVRLGYVTAEDAERIDMRRGKRGFGRAALARGAITQVQLEYALGVHLGFLHEHDDPTPIPPALFTAKNPYGKQAEEIRALRSRLSVGAAESKNFPLAISGDGADLVAANLAISFAQLGKSTLLIDADLRRPGAAALFAVRGAAGLCEVVAGVASYERARAETLIKNLHILPAGAPAPDPHSVLGGDGLQALMARAAREFDIVITATGMFDPTGGCELVWLQSAAVLVVARKDKSQLRDISELRAALRRADANLAGAVLVT